MTDRHPAERVEQLQDALEDGFAMLDSELRYVMLNEAMAAMNGVPLAEHLGRTVSDVIPTLAPTLEPLLRHVLVTGEAVIDLEVHGVPEGAGTIRRWLASFSPMRSRTGQIVAIDVVVRELPVLTRSSSSTPSFSTQQEREYFAARVTELSPFLIYIYDLQTHRNRYVNGRLEQLYGYTHAELETMGAHFLFRLLHPDDVPGVLGQIERLRAAADDEVLQHEYRFRHKDGSWRWLCSHELVFKRDAMGAVTQVLGIAEDISARKTAEAALQWQASLIDHSHEAVLLWNGDGLLSFWSKGAERLYGFNQAEALGQPGHELLQTQQRKELPRISAELERNGRWSGELTRVTKDGRQVVVGIRMTEISGPEGQRQVLETNRDLTARKATEQALQSREQRWRFALRAAGMIAWEIDFATSTVTWMPDAEAFFGFPPGAFGSRFPDALAVVHPDDRAGASAAVERALVSGLHQSEFRLLRPDGSVVWVRDQGEVVYDAQGAPHRLLGISQDITALKAAQEALRLSEERFRVALQSSPVVVFNQDRALHYTWIYNPALGYSPDEVVGTTDYELFERRQDADAIVALKRQVLADGQGRRDEVWVWSEGAQLCYDLTVEPLRDADGQLIGVTCAAVDISAHKQREQALRRANVRLALALDRLDGFLYEHDLRTGQVEWSEGLVRVLGYAPGTVPAVPDGWFSLIHPDDAPVCIDILAIALASETGYSAEYRVRHHDGHYLTVWDRGKIERDEQGHVVRVIGTTIDITERQKAAAERAELLVREQQAHRLTEAALARAEEATRERDLLISIASHDLRTPLTVILGQAQLLQRRATRAGLDERSKRTLDTIAEQAERLNQMIVALLDLSRIQEGRLTIQPELFDLGALLMRVVGAVQSTVTVHEVTLRPLDSPTLLYADPLRIEQVFLNLLGNAVKYSPNGGSITIWAERDGQQVRVHIRDQGIGIPDEALPHLFTRFYRAPNATAQTTSSLGVGLFVVRELVHAHSGTISVSTALNQGSTFTVSLPLPDTD